MKVQAHDRRRAARALVHARALLRARGSSQRSEHLTYDLSEAGVRVCGVPRARTGDRMEVELDLPTGRAMALGRLVRAAPGSKQLDFAISFLEMDPLSKLAIRGAVAEALLNHERRSILLIPGQARAPSRLAAWLRPIRPICATATTALQALRQLDGNPAIRLGITDPTEGEGAGEAWASIRPEIMWRTIDAAGCLRELSDPAE